MYPSLKSFDAACLQLITCASTLSRGQFPGLIGMYQDVSKVEKNVVHYIAAVITIKFIYEDCYPILVTHCHTLLTTFVASSSTAVHGSFVLIHYAIRTGC